MQVVTEHAGSKMSPGAPTPSSDDVASEPVVRSRNVRRWVAAGAAAALIFLAGALAATHAPAFVGGPAGQDNVAVAPPSQELAIAPVASDPPEVLASSAQPPSPEVTAAPSPVAIQQGEWVQNPRPATLWSQSREPAKKLGDLPEKSRLKVMSTENDARVLVYHEAQSSKGESVSGWVNRTDLQPASGDGRISASSRGGARADAGETKPEEFIASMVEAAQDSQRQDKVPASVTIAQAIVESEWGRSGLSRDAHNYFGIKAGSGSGPAGVVSMNTREVYDGQDVVIKDGFKAYHNAYESVMDHGRILAKNSRYAAAFKTSDPVEFARRVHAGGYATDPEYCTKLEKVMDSYNLYQYDLG